MEDPKYLRAENIDEIGKRVRIKALMNLRCGNIVELNKYQLKEGEKRCVFCEEGWDNLKHYVRKCKELGDKFSKLGRDKEKITDKLQDDELGKVKSRILGRIWKEREKEANKRKEKKKELEEEANRKKKM